MPGIFPADIDGAAFSGAPAPSGLSADEKLAYWEYWGKGYFNAKGVSIPVAVSVFPDELYPAPRSWTERAYPKLIHYNKLDKGGHFAAWEQPQLFVESCARVSSRFVDTTTSRSQKRIIAHGMELSRNFSILFP
jgi:hypothetical protein